MMWWNDGWSGAWVWFAMAHVLWWVLIIIGIVTVVRWVFSIGTRGGRVDGEDRALEVLRERYARGEITQDEFEERKRGLKG